MAITCVQVAAILEDGGREGLADQPEAQDHIGECESCADRLIALDQAEAPPPVPEVPPPVPEAPPLVPEAPPPVPEAPPPVASSVDSVTWLPESMPAPPANIPIFAGSRSAFAIRPAHLWLVGIGSALFGALVTLLIVLMLRPEDGEPPIAVAEESLGADAVESAMDDLVPVFSRGEEEVEGEVEADVEEAIGVSKGGSKRKAGKSKQKGHVGTPSDPSLQSSSAASGSVSNTPLTTAEISAGIKKNLGKLGPCFVAARKRKEVEPGKHTLVLDFLIMPNGSVRDAALTGPEDLTRKRIAKCVSGNLRQWRFPASAGGSPVRKLNLPITVK